MVTSSAAGGGVILPPGVRPLEITDPADIGAHRLVGRLGSGGMGVVYLAVDPLGGFVAIKAAHDESTGEELRLRFQAEAGCMGRVPSAYTARLLTDGTDQTPPYIITEYLEGRSLEYIVENDGPLRDEQLRALAAGIARALAAIHEAGLIHRDLKPANVVLTPTGPRLIDFGIAQQSPHPVSGGLTGADMVMGSPGWISPERLTRGPATPAADIFCWGCLIAYAGTGRHPFGEDLPDEVARRTIHEPPMLDGLDASFRHQVEAALAKSPAERPSADELVTSFQTGESVAVVRRPRRGRHSRPPSAVRRRVRQAAGLTAGSAAVAIVATLMPFGPDGAGPKPGATAAPPTRAAGPHRTAVPKPHGSAGGDALPVSAPRRPQAPHQQAAPGHNAVKATGKQPAGDGIDTGQNPAGTAGHTLDQATTAAPTAPIDDLLSH